jgi:hypothetical protein
MLTESTSPDNIGHFNQVLREALSVFYDVVPEKKDSKGKAARVRCHVCSKANKVLFIEVKMKKLGGSGSGWLADLGERSR